MGQTGYVTSIPADMRSPRHPFELDFRVGRMLGERNVRVGPGRIFILSGSLRAWTGSQAGERLAAGDDWQNTGLVFTSHLGAALDAGNVRKMFKRICTEAGAGDSWTPRELRTTFVSLMSQL
jgi:hypothetical protein